MECSDKQDELFKEEFRKNHNLSPEELSAFVTEVFRKHDLGKKYPICHPLYQATANKRIGDLTMKQSDQIVACKVLGLYE